MLLTKKHKKYYILFFCIALGMVGFYIEPIRDLDLYRYFNQMDIMQQLDFKEFILEYIFQPELISNLIFYFVAKIDAYGLLCMIAVIVSYYIVIKCVLDYSDRKNIKLIERVVVLVLVLSVMTFSHFAVRIRNNIGIVICAYAFYREYVQEKKNWLTKVLYILPCFIHTSMLFGVIIRMILFLKKKYLKIALIIIMLILFFGTNFIIILGDLLSNVAMFSSYSTKISAYIVNNTEYEPTNVKVKFAFMLFMLLNIIYVIKKYNYLNENRNYVKLVLTIDLIIISLVQYNDIFLRFFYLALFINIKLFIDTIKLLKGRDEKIVYFAVLLLFTMAHLYLQKTSFADLRFPEFFDNILLNTFSFVIRLFIT